MPAPATNTVARRPRRDGGVTLTEVLAVMVITAILAGTAVPAIGSITNTREEMAKNQLLRDLSFARQYAMATGRITWVEFDEAGESYDVLAEDPSNPGKANALAITDPATGRDFTQTLDVDSFVGVEILAATFDTGDDVGFDWIGRPLNDTGAEMTAATGSVTLTGGKSVTIVKATGYMYGS
ncbi:MAG: prepilin-type N-terminal cleavage/methylation domain-containing protein [Phycisphaerales bacterium]|nr:prepilin-type N-terminal cleavage/methylation domain-containing protein [Phycisphaerae bacterium]NNF43333.1 prepilin-type N-terminal cleavage/methylation domain-containing protein [Phycisphaerales bacterium]NNM25843.1 prepilin-type N-terminal cleavage/methylation domain-containing protein [Phycisphaerales bacterium]